MDIKIIFVIVLGSYALGFGIGVGQFVGFSIARFFEERRGKKR